MGIYNKVRGRLPANVMQMLGNLETPGSTQVTVLEKDGAEDVLLARGTTVPSNAETGYAKGAIFIDTDVVTGISGMFENVGTTTSCIFSAVGSTLPAGSIDATEVADGTADGGNYVQKYAVAVYDFSVDGGLVSTITLADNFDIPTDAIVTGFAYKVESTLISSGDLATIKFGLVTDGDLTTTIAIGAGGNSWDAGVFSALAATGAFQTAPETVLTTGIRKITMTIAVEALTAGDITFYVQYMIAA